MTHVRLAQTGLLAAALLALSVIGGGPGGRAAAQPAPAPAETAPAAPQATPQTTPPSPAAQIEQAPLPAPDMQAAPAPAQPLPAQPSPVQPSPAPATPPAQPAPPVQATPGEAPPPPAGTQHPDAVTGEMTVLNPMPVLTKTGMSSWAEGFDNIVVTLDAITAQMGRLGLRRAGDVMIVYTSSDESGFEFEAQIPFAGESAERPGDDVKIGASYSGRVMKFHHSGSFADMDTTYEGVANYLDSRNAEAQDFYIERYLTDPTTTEPDALQVDIFVPLR